jgi:hypothetical protein
LVAARPVAHTYGEPPGNIAGRLTVAAGAAAAVITPAATTRRPRYPVGTVARGLFAPRRWLPASAVQASSGPGSPSGGGDMAGCQDGRADRKR